MVLVILGIGLVVMIVGLVLECKEEDKYGFITWEEHSYIWGPGLIVSAGALIAIIVLFGCTAKSRYIPEKIEMYEQENAAIEEQITDVVNDYMEYEQGIFEDISPDEAMTVVLLYPDLKANTVVEKQMEVYINNNQKIKELKEDYISAKVYKWWLYFGG